MDGLIKLIWIPIHSGITETSKQTRQPKNQEISENELCAPEDLKKWLRKKETKNRQTR
jgi:hypothetical protein